MSVITRGSTDGAIHRVSRFLIHLFLINIIESTTYNLKICFTGEHLLSWNWEIFLSKFLYPVSVQFPDTKL